ncbi:UvrD-helicase domain-containing protein [Actinokineospora sp.]|uniref:UvrD-helicase domain-containing protein n=1 Tax=Actinokineospora sp. TaxID=1872133 RepID=UPI003D6B56A5
MTYAPTVEQQAVIDACAAGKAVVVEAAAGAGKTSTLRLAAGEMRGRVLYVAYNRAAADEAKASFPAHVRCSTIHGLAFGAVGRDFSRRLGGRRVPAKVTAERLGVRDNAEIGAGLTVTPVHIAKLALATVTRFCQSADLEVGKQHLPSVPGILTEAQLGRMHRKIPELRSAGEHQAAAEAHAAWDNGLRARHDLARLVLPVAQRAWDDLTDRWGEQVPFAHDHYLKMWQIAGPRLSYDVVMLDEAQDSNPCRSALVVGQEHAQRIAIGDSCQQLYAWQGAVDALATWPADVRLQLTQSWRFGGAVAAEANKWLTLLGTDMRVRGNPNLPTVVGPIPTPDAILCRSNAGAVGRVLAALEDGQRPALVGGATELVQLADAAGELQAGKRTSHPELWAFESWTQVQEYAEEEQGADLRVFVKLVDQYGPAKITTALSRTVPEDGADVVISTAHKSKGREWDRVAIADDFAEPKPDKDGNPRPVDKADAMVAYVAVTRARDALDRTGLAWVDRYVGPAAAITSARKAPAA